MHKGWMFLFLFSLCSAVIAQPMTKQYCEKMTNIVRQIAIDRASGMNQEDFFAKLSQSMENYYQKEGSVLQDSEDLQRSVQIALTAWRIKLEPDEADSIFLPTCLGEVPKLQNQI